jgi:hypothetical protein
LHPVTIISYPYSFLRNDKCAGVDAFAEFWGDKRGLSVPPVIIMARVIRKMQSDKANGVLVVPLWESANFWPLLNQGNRFISNVIDWIDLPTNKESYISCKNGKGIFGNGNLKFRMLALRVIF